jgi:pilus assembly protein Flp/PilA
MLLKSYIAAQLRRDDVVTQLRRDDGATAVEYALLVSLIAIVMVAALVFLGPKIAGIFNQAGSKL